MESNGKTVTKDGSRVDYETGVSYHFSVFRSLSSSLSSGDKAVPTVNTPSTSSFTRVPSSSHGRSIPLELADRSDFLAPAQTLNPISGGKHHEILLSNFFAQPECVECYPLNGANV